MNSCSSGVLIATPDFFSSATSQSFLNATLCDRDLTLFHITEGFVQKRTAHIFASR
jgi:hypothetical protein